MPYVSIRVGGKLTKEQKKQIASEVCQTLEKVAGKPPKSTYVVFDEVDRDSWAVGDQLLSERG